MIRRVIEINNEKCNGCGACARACHEGAIGMVDGKAKLMRDDYCDGLGDCLPNCPTGAITFIEREAAAYDEQAVQENKKKQAAGGAVSHGCPGSAARSFVREEAAPAAPHVCPGSASRSFDRPTVAHTCPGSAAHAISHEAGEAPAVAAPVSQLRQWPVQIKLAPVNAPYFDGANLLIAADCSAYAYANFHQEFIRGRITLVGCPKLDAVDYSEKLTEILRRNNIKSVLIVRMEVPCCGGLEQAAITALKNSGKFLPWQVVTLSTDGRILDL